MKLKDFLRSAILIVALSAVGISSGIAADKNAKHSSKITKARAERIALTKVPGGRIHTAELETVRGRRFWSVYIAKPGSKNAKEIRVDATSGQILAVQTERPEEIWPKSLQKPLKRTCGPGGFLHPRPHLLCPMASRPLLKLNQDALATESRSSKMNACRL
jgi:Peptidase propeptide and YPEB domain